MSEQELTDRLDAVDRMPYGRAQIAAIEETLRLIDAERLTRLQYIGRLVATSAYTYGGEPAKAFVPFSWCVAAHDRGEGDQHWDHNMFWAFKAMVSKLTQFPEVPLERTYAVLDDMERRYRRAGYTMNPVHEYRVVVAQHIGDRVTADEQYRLWCAAPRGQMSDCIGCEPTVKVEFLTWRGRYEEAVALALPVLDGQLTCIEQPQSILTALLLPYVRTGQLAEAADAHRRAYRAIQANRGELSLLADHLEFCAATGNTGRGMELVQRHLGWLDEPPTPHAEMRFAAAAAAVLRQVAEAGHGDAPVRETTVGALRDELGQRALALALRFDERNRTAEQSELVEALLAAEPIVDQLPLSGPVRRAVREAPPAPTPVDLPADPAALADLADRAVELHDAAGIAAIWARFDEVCPEPRSTLLGRRLVGAAVLQSIADPASAGPAWLWAADAFREAGDELAQNVALSRWALGECRNGDAAAGLSALEAHAERIEKIGGPADRLRVQLRLAEALRLAGRDAQATLETVHRLALLVTDPLLQARAASDRAEVTGDVADAEQAVALYRTAGPSDALRKALLLSALARAGRGDLAAADDLLTEAGGAADPMLRSQVAATRGRIALGQERPEDAYELFTTAAATLTEAGLIVPAAFTQVDLAEAALRADRPAELADAAEEALPVLEQVGDDEEVARCRFLLSKAYRALGQLDQAVDLLGLVERQCAATGNAGGVGQMRHEAATVLDQLDRDGEAAERFEAAAQAYASIPDQDLELAMRQLDCRRRASLSWLWAQEPERAYEALAAAQTLAGGITDDDPAVTYELALLGYDAARIFANTGRAADGQPRAAAAADRFRGIGAATEAAVADALQGRLLLDLGRPDEAERILAAALAGLPAEADGPREELTALLAEIRS